MLLKIVFGKKKKKEKKISHLIGNFFIRLRESELLITNFRPPWVAVCQEEGPALNSGPGEGNEKLLRYLNFSKISFRHNKRKEICKVPWSPVLKIYIYINKITNFMFFSHFFPVSFLLAFIFSNISFSLIFYINSKHGLVSDAKKV